MFLDAEQIAPILDLYDRGLYLQSYHAGKPFGCLQQWAGPRGRIMAARLASHLGAPRLARLQILNAWREDPTDAEVIYYHGQGYFEKHGLLEAWRFLCRQSFPENADPDLRSSWQALFARVLSALRDFDAAEEWMRTAEQTDPDSPWVHVNWCYVLQVQDRYDEALASIDRALSLRPWYRPAVQARGHLLPLLGRDDEALDFLRQASSRLESSSVQLQLTEILVERDEYDGLSDMLRRVDELCPLLETGYAKSLSGLRSLIAYRLGDLDQVIELARQSKNKFELKSADRLADPLRRDRKRVRLDVGFVRQHHQTCVPATLTAISRFWSMKAEHLRIAESICYNGTSSYNERRWADQNGWYTREFTVTEESVDALISAGIPFTLTTTNPGSGHLQAVIGYDGLRGTAIIRDPYERTWGEGFVDEIIEAHQAFGPRGMAMVPSDQKDKLQKLSLPDPELWDALHEFDGLLESHQREAAEQRLNRLRQEAPEHRITLEAERRLMIYDANSPGILATVDKLLKLYPDSQTLVLQRIARLRDLGRRDERIAELRRQCDRQRAHPAFLSHLAQEFAPDARRHAEALDLLKLAIRRNPEDAGNFYIRAGILADQLKFDEALELYRFAACLDEKNENTAEAYFRMARYQKQTEAGLDWLRQRVTRLGQRSSFPARTLSWALRQLSRDAEAVAVIEQAVEQRPNDGGLLLHAAEVEIMASFSNVERAREYLRRAEGHSPRTDWLRAKARLATLENDQAEALRCWREVSQLQPMATDANAAIANLLSKIEGQAAALAHLSAAAERFPHHQPSYELSIEWLRDEPPEVREPVVRRLIEVNPSNAWAHRELGFLLVQQQRLDEAEKCAETAGNIDPTHVAWHHLRGELFEKQGRLAEARAEFRAAIKLSVDNEFAISNLLWVSESSEIKIQQLEFLRHELARQVIYGDGLLSYQSHATRLIPPDELLRLLREAHAARPDLWHSWIACVKQLADMNQLDAAYDLVCQASERFPFLPRVWLERARVCHLRLDADGELTALEKSLEINPMSAETIRRLSDVYLRRADFAKAAELLHRGVAIDPSDGQNHGFLADVQWQQGDRAAAFDSIERAVRLAPGYSWAWETLRYWSQEANDSERPLRAARELTETRPGEARSWLIYARTLGNSKGRETDSLAALQRAIALNPRSIEGHDQVARTLCELDRIDEALAACRPEVFGENPPAMLRKRAAMIRWTQQERQAAVQALREVTQVEPAFYAGWSQLYEWCNELEDFEGSLEAAKMMLRLAPHDDDAMGMHADALRQAGKRQEAKEAYYRTFELTPSNEVAGLWLFDYQIEDGEIQAAESTYNKLSAHHDGPFVQSKRAVLAAYQKDRVAASTAFQLLCRDPIENEWPLTMAYEAMKKFGGLLDVRCAIEAACEADNPEPLNPFVGSLWVRAHTEAKKWNMDEGLKKLLARHPAAGGQAIHAWTQALNNAGKTSKFRRSVRKGWPWLRSTTFSWGVIGWGLIGEDMKLALKWMEDWKSFSDLEPWMLLNVSEAFRWRQRQADAAEVNRFALTLPHDHAAHAHEVWLAADAALKGETAAARELIAQTDRERLDNKYNLILDLIGPLLDFLDAPAEGRQALFPSIRERIAKATDRESIRSDPARQRLYSACVRGIAKAVGGWWPWLWAYHRILLVS